MDNKNVKDELRRARLRALITRAGGHAKFVSEYKLTQSQSSYLSQIVNGYSFGEKSAEKWRALLKLPKGYFDIPSANMSADREVHVLTHEYEHLMALLKRMTPEARNKWIEIGNLFADKREDRRKENIEHAPERRGRVINDMGHGLSNSSLESKSKRDFGKEKGK
jgi:hypothetical protein